MVLGGVFGGVTVRYPGVEKLRRRWRRVDVDTSPPAGLLQSNLRFTPVNVLMVWE